MTPKSPSPGRKAVFAGTFNPFTIGHADIVERGLAIFDHVAICVGANYNKPGEQAGAEARAQAISELYADDPRVSVHCWPGLTAELAQKVGASHLLRGVRTVKDCEYERDMADANRKMFGLETVVLFTDPALSYVSSSLVRELAAHGQDVSRFLPRK